MREIGSEFWDVQTTTKENDLFPESTQWFLSGRSALQAIIKELKNAQSVAMPSWCCDSMIKPFSEAGIKVQFYPVDFQTKAEHGISCNCDVLFLMDYFGYTVPTPDLTDYKGVTIRDVTHSIFSNTYNDADYYFGSLRKWCGVWTGGYAWTEDGHRLIDGVADDDGYSALREKAMMQKTEYITERRTDKEYLKVFEEAEDLLEKTGVVLAAKRDIELAKKLDVEFIRTRRRANAEILRKAFQSWLLFPTMKSSDCPMFVPVIAPDGKRDELRKFLIQQGIYCPVHWPVSEYHQLDEKINQLYKNELSLVCDQRYTEKDMNRMVETINVFWKPANKKSSPKEDLTKEKIVGNR